MNESTYAVVKKFTWGGEAMVTVMLNSAACVMSESDYDWMIKVEQRAMKRKGL